MTEGSDRISGGLLAFIIWELCAGVFFAIGMYSFFAKKPMGFWANARRPSAEDITDVGAYNKAVGKMWCVFGIVFMVLGIPLLSGQNSSGAILSILGTMWAVIVLAVIYTRIERKYRRKQEEGRR